MSIPWEKVFISAAVGFIGLTLLKPKFFFQANQGYDTTSDVKLATCVNSCVQKCQSGGYGDYNFESNQGQFFGFSGPNIQTSPDVLTPNCTPAGYGGSSLARYCNPPGVKCGYGVDCADARVQYCRTYGIGGVCHDQYGNIIGAVEGDQGLPGQGPVVGGGLLDLVNSFGWGAVGGGGYGYPQQQGYGYGYGYGYNPYGYGYGYNPYYGYGYPYGYNPYRYQVRRGYQGSVIYDKKTGHFLYGAQAVVTPIAGGAAKLPAAPSYDQSIVTPCVTGDC